MRNPLEVDADTALREIGDAPIEAYWRSPKPSNEYNPTVSLFLPHSCFLSGNYFIRSEEGMYVNAGTLRVTHPELRGHGIGERLTKSLGALAIKYKCVRITAKMASEFALDVAANVFGESRLSFYGNDTETGRATELHLSHEEARELLAKMGLMESDPEHRNMTIETQVDLSELDPTDWEPPKEASLDADFDFALLGVVDSNS